MCECPAIGSNDAPIYPAACRAVIGFYGRDRRKIALNVPHWLVATRVLKKTDLVTVMPRYLAMALMDSELRMEELPFKSAPFQWMMYWHRRYDQNKPNLWLRDQISQVCASLAER